MGRTGQHLARQNRETGCVELADLLPRDGLGSGDVPGRLRAASDGKTVDGKRSVADNSPLGAADDRVDDDVSLEGLRRPFLGDRQGHVNAVADRDRERSRYIFGDDGMTGGQRSALTSRVHARSLEHAGLRPIVHREAGAVRLVQAQLVEGVHSDQLIACGHPAVEGLHRDRYLVVRGRLRQAICREVLLNGCRGPMERYRLHITAMPQPGRGLIPL